MAPPFLERDPKHLGKRGWRTTLDCFSHQWAVVPGLSYHGAPDEDWPYLSQVQPLKNMCVETFPLSFPVSFSLCFSPSLLPTPFFFFYKSEGFFLGLNHDQPPYDFLVICSASAFKAAPNVCQHKP